MTVMIQGFLLGLASGASCLASCAPVLFPFMVAESRSIRQNILPVIHFLGGRLAGYLIFAVIAWQAGKWIRSEPRGGLIFGAVYAILACVLVLYGFGSFSNTCAAGSMRGGLGSLASRWPAALPASMGLLTGLSLCPPFITAIAGATGQTSLLSSLLFFAFFFMATSLYMIPFPFAGLMGRSRAIRITGRLAAGVMGCYYFYRGLIMIYGGLRS